ncbi:transcriptional regulator, LuxR family [Thalassovita litoralis]|jgi:DNA-binding CsgD family transcriptional regulator|uniref:Transcriptional regulator, LuxR family n=1 Tax=Thalassovita litoralis TaxID=1010611 RepID=A0A521EJS3_9RHOB|nr:autoinducer binding domain-containing protein [Thalassovita litoralis]SMO84178.1 transcriptional regulator, LuxR family [Thalassovita litoralis]
MNIVDLSTLRNRDVDFVQFLNELCDSLGFDYASYATSSPISGDVQGYANYPDSWKLHYMQRGLHRIDPTLHKSALSIAPVDWSRFTQDKRFNTVFSDAGDFGITPRGLTVPVRGPYGDCGLLNVTRKCSDAEWYSQIRHVVGELQVAAVHIHDRVMHSGILHKALATPILSQRELEILQWVAVGKSQQDVGDILSISHRTVEVHLRSSREKLGALTTAQAIGRAIGLGMIHPG